MHFTKIQGAGNDFVILNNMDLKLPIEIFPALARRVCARRISVGGDALMVADTPTQGGDLQMRFYNSDGSEGEMCGNGVRCLARFATEHGIADDFVRIETVAGEVQAWRQDRRSYKVRLNDPSVLKLDVPVSVDGIAYACSYVELGCPGLPHAVVYYPGLAAKSQDEMRCLGAALRSHSAFPKGANVNFYDLEPDGAVRLLTFERGVEDFTLACGTGAGSAAAVLICKGLAASPVYVRSPGGELTIQVERTEPAVTGLFLIGDTNIIIEGDLTDEDIVLT